MAIFRGYVERFYQKIAVFWANLIKLFGKKFLPEKRHSGNYAFQGSSYMIIFKNSIF